jgi:predicted transcriptional regulator YdeE/general stress protein 26
MGGIAGLSDEQKKTAEDFINAQMYGVVATNHPDTGARLSCLNNMPGQTMGKLYFATDSASSKIANILSDPRCEVMYTDGNSQMFLKGKAVVVDDKALKKAKWVDYMYDYFKEGPDGAQYCLVEFIPDEARIMLAEEAVFETVTLEPVSIMGIAVRTSNLVQQSTNDIGNLWKRFWDEDIMSKIPGKTSNVLYAVYTEYEGDAMAPYTMVIGCPVRSTDNIPEGMKAVVIEGGRYAKTIVEGNLSEGIIQQGWMKVWQSKLDRKYQADFEYYKCDGSDPDHAEVDIFVGIR